jgi:hypothetical protein
LARRYTSLAQAKEYVFLVFNLFRFNAFVTRVDLDQAALVGYIGIRWLYDQGMLCSNEYNMKILTTFNYCVEDKNTEIKLIIYYMYIHLEFDESVHQR